MFYYTITRADNGYILKILNENETDMSQETFVFQETEDENKTLADLLTTLAEHLGKPYDKWGGENIRITFDMPGHKMDGYEQGLADPGMSK